MEQERLYLNNVLEMGIAEYVLKLGIAQQCIKVSYFLTMC